MVENITYQEGTRMSLSLELRIQGSLKVTTMQDGGKFALSDMEKLVSMIQTNPVINYDDMRNLLGPRAELTLDNVSVMNSEGGYKGSIKLDEEVLHFSHVADLHSDMVLPLKNKFHAILKERSANFVKKLKKLW